MKPTQSLAQSNVAKLPAQCFGIVLGNAPGKRVSIIKCGESGYYSTSEPATLRAMSRAELEVEIDRMNAEDGVTKAQRSAMEHGSMFGWECEGANPDNPINNR